MRKRLSSRLGFTLIEILVVIAIIAILIALLVPAVQKVRAAADRTQCQNNIKQIALATHGYHDALKQFPLASSGGPNYFSGMTQIMPFLEQEAISKRWDATKGPADDSTIGTLGYSNKSLCTLLVPTYLCPSMNPPMVPLTDNIGYSSYLFCSGTFYEFGFTALPASAFDGVVIPSTAVSGVTRVRMTDVADGTSNTFLVGECDFKLVKSPANPTLTDYRTSGGRWSYAYTGYSWTTTWGKFNEHKAYSAAEATAMGCSNQYECGGPANFRSEHFGGAHFGMTDGAVQFVSENITKATYRALSTRFGNEPVSVFSN